MGKRIVFLVLCCLVLQGCNRSQDGSETVEQAQELSANDLAFLMPLESDRNIPRQVVAVADPDYGILSEGNFREIIATSRRQAVFVDNNIANSNNWLLVSFRYSPCIHFVGEEQACKEQIRFVFQPIERGNEGLSFRDYAMHVVYEYKGTSQPENSDVLASFRALNLLSGGLNEDQPLQPHPVLKNPNFNSTYFEFIKNSIIAKYVKTQKPKVVTFMGLGVDQSGNLNRGLWHFFAGQVNSGGLWQLHNLPTGGTERVVDLGFFNNGSLSTNLSQSREVQFNLFEGNNVNNPTLHTNIFNPISTNDHNTDCASCHVTDNQIFRRNAVLQTSQNSQFSNSFFDQIDRIGRISEVLVDNRYRGGHSVPDEIVTRIFGYMNAEPVISQRMVNSNAFAVKSANNLAGLTIPRRQCHTQQERQQVSQCLLSGNIRETLRGCIERFCTSGPSDGDDIQFGD